MRSRIEAGTIANMNLAVTSSVSARVDTPSASAAATLARKIGEVDVKWHRNESLYAGAELGAPVASLEGALAGAAGIALESGSSVALVRTNDGYQAQQLLQPLWTKSFGRERAYSLAPTQLIRFAAQANPGEPMFGFHKLVERDGYGRPQRIAREGTIQLDPRSGVVAIVDADWALVDGGLRSVTPTRPNRPAPPTPPVDPTPPTDPVDPPAGPTGRTLVEDLTEAVRLAKESARIIGEVPTTDKGDESTKATRIKAYKTNMAAQTRLERQFSNTSADVVSTLRSADASLEDANWQLAKKPSPDGRFNGVDIPGAIRDTERAVQLLDTLLDSLVHPKAA